MYKLIIENSKKEQLELTHNSMYSIKSIDGLYPPPATINLTKSATMDGSKFNSSRVGERNIVIELAIEAPVEANRINLYKYVKAKQYIKIYWINGSRNVWIEGYVENMPIQFFEMKQIVQISIICPFPFFRNSKESITNFSSVTYGFEFPFSIPKEGVVFSEFGLITEKSAINNGDISSGVIIELVATGLVLNPKIYNSETREYFFLNFEMESGDKITINTNKGKKGITLLRDGVESNIINKHAIGSTWFQLQPGDNIFICEADEYPENLSCTFIQTDLFEGV